MKKLLLFFCLVTAVACSQAQTAPRPFIPPYHILNLDSVYVTPANLNRTKPSMIIYFSPDCSHCQHLMFEMKPHLDQLKDIQIVMISFTRTEYPYMKLLRNFSTDYGLGKYHNITIGTEYPTYKVQQYYQLKTTPYIAIYDRDGKLVKAFEKVPEMDTLMTAVKIVQPKSRKIRG